MPAFSEDQKKIFREGAIHFAASLFPDGTIRNIDSPYTDKAVLASEISVCAGLALLEELSERDDKLGYAAARLVHDGVYECDITVRPASVMHEDHIDNFVMALLEPELSEYQKQLYDSGDLDFILSECQIALNGDYKESVRKMLRKALGAKEEERQTCAMS